MSLTKPRPGDKLDRMSILARKIVEGREDFWAEYNELAEGTGIDKEFILAALNAAIWQREDAIRAMRGKEVPPETVAATAFAIQGLNDQRAALIAELNGGKSEKLYK